VCCQVIDWIVQGGPQRLARVRLTAMLIPVHNSPGTLATYLLNEFTCWEVYRMARARPSDTENERGGSCGLPSRDLDVDRVISGGAVWNAALHHRGLQGTGRVRRPHLHRVSALRRIRPLV
jgi:hypothetical protein